MLKSKIDKNKYALCIFIMLSLDLVIHMPLKLGELQEWTMSYYVLSYDIGFSKRFFMGSVLRLFAERLTPYFFMIFWTVSTLILLAFTALFIGRSIASLDGDTRTSACIFAGLFLVSPASVRYLFCPQNFGRLDIYLILLVLVCIYLIPHRYVRWLVPALCVVCILIHQAFLFMFMPVVSILLLYNVTRSEKKFGSIALCIVSWTAMIVSFCYLQFFSDVPFADETQMSLALAPHADFDVVETMLWLEYFLPVPQHFDVLCRDLLPVHLRGLATFAVISLPMSAALFTTWRRAMRAAVSKLVKFVYFLCIIAPIALLPNFVLTIDWSRWVACIVITQFFLLFAMLRSGSEEVRDAVAGFLSGVRRHPVLCSCAFIAMALFTVLSIKDYNNGGEFLARTLGVFIR